MVVWHANRPAAHPRQAPTISPNKNFQNGEQMVSLIYGDIFTATFAVNVD
jgi:hypothetical protein